MLHKFVVFTLLVVLAQCKGQHNLGFEANSLLIVGKVAFKVGQVCKGLVQLVDLCSVKASSGFEALLDLWDGKASSKFDPLAAGETKECLSPVDSACLNDKQDKQKTANDNQGSKTEVCTFVNRAKYTGMAAIVLYTASPLIGYYGLAASMGLGAAGPVAGGWFAANMGAGLSAGGLMASLQSLAMGGNVAAANILTAITAALGGLSVDQIIQFLNSC